MTLSPGILALVLLAALLHATWNAIVKGGPDKLLGATMVLTWAAAPAVVLAFFVPIPAAESWPYLAASVIIHTGYYLSLVAAYEVGDLSQVYPIARGSAPVLVSLGAFALAGEMLSGTELLGVVIVTLGIWTLAWRRGGLKGDGRGVALALLTGLTIAGYSLADALGARASGAPLGYIAWMFILEPLPLVAYAYWRRGSEALQIFTRRIPLGLGSGMIAAAAYGIVIWAMTFSPMAHVVALRETSVVLAALIGTFLLGEPGKARRIGAAVVVAGGTIILQAGG